MMGMCGLGACCSVQAFCDEENIRLDMGLSQGP